MVNMYIDLDRLSQYAENVAKTMEPAGWESASRIGGRVAVMLKEIRDICQSVEGCAKNVIKMPSELEWLLDNRYIAEREAKGVIKDLKNAKKLTASYNGKEKKAVIYEAAESLVRSGKNELTEERLRLFLESFQNGLILSEKELSLFIPMLKLALIDNLRHCAREIYTMLQARDNPESPYYAEEYAEKLRNRGESIPEDITEKVRTAHEAHERMTATMSAVFTSLRVLAGMDSGPFLESVSRIERTLLNDPAGVYSCMKQESRNAYRQELARIAKRKGISEHEAAAKLIKLAKGCEHIGYYIYRKPLGEKKKVRKGSLYAGFIVLPSLFLSLYAAFVFNNIWLFLLLFLPLTEISKNLCDYLVLKFTRPSYLPRMDLENGIPAEGRTLCVISALIGSSNAGSEYAKLLEQYALANRKAGGELIFGVLADLKESNDERLETDGEYIDAAIQAVSALNAKYGGGFYLFSRKRTRNAIDGHYMGWERKRGAIVELVRLIKGEASGITINVGTKLGLDGVKYIIQLDTDTRLNVNSALEMVGAMLHPLNTPVIDSNLKMVVEGHGILQPRIAVDLAAANKSDFTRIFAGQGGVDPYGSNSGDVYQDLFDEGSFTGKGILSVDAFFECLDRRFPENTILSHDLIEGSYLRAGYLGDVELTDGFPSKITAYYDRMHRWIRGDWQVSPWLSKRVKTEDGEKSFNPIRPINKWKITDNLRRSLTPVSFFNVIYLSMFLNNRGIFAALLIVLCSLSSNLLISSLDTMSRPGGALKPKYKSSVIYGFAARLMQAFIQLMFLPYSAWTALSATCTALYRMYVSKRNMLSWVTAADSERRSNDSLFFYYRKIFFAPLCGIIAIFLSPFAGGAALGLLWVCTPALAYAMSRETSDYKPPSEEERLFLTRAANDIWRYFDKMLTPARNFLPPDNWQEEPAVGTAERSSPTNIGLAALSALAAFDLGLCEQEQCIGVVENILTSMERLPKWHGHLYNWYDIRTMKPLEPRYISTVDSGNLAGCIITLIEGLKECGGDMLIDRLQRLLDGMKFEPLYDKNRRLFYIGYDAVENTPTKSWYDLMASEARQTSYIAIARGEIDKKHWQTLGRTLASVDRRSGMASWTGTMFEYFMPNLLMPWYKNSLIHESLKFCLYAHKKRSNPWGISESAFYSFDAALNYKYKAHGVQGLALKRGMERENVVSPYSTFLALPFELTSSVYNLKKLKKYDAEGRFGYYEAIDFTESRVGSKGYEPVKCFMAHHLGMSLLAIDNALRSGIMQKRFMRNPEMASFTELLQEKGPVGQLILTRQQTEIPEKPDRSPTEIWKKHIAGTDILNPSCQLLSNGAYTVLVSELGASMSVWEDMRVTKFSHDRFGEENGMSFFLKSGKDFISLLPSPEYDNESTYHCDFSGERARIYSKRRSVESCMELVVPQGEIGEQRSVLIRNNANEIRDFELYVYFEPVLASERDYRAHPAFSKLTLESSIADDIVMIKRRDGVRGKSASLCFACSEKMLADTFRERTLGRGGLRVVSFAESSGSAGAMLDPCVLARVKFSLRSGESKKVYFALSLSDDIEAARMSAQRILKHRRTRGLPYLDSIAKRMDMCAVDIEEAMSRLGSLVYNTGDQTRKSAEAGCNGKQALWRFGISGDFPVMSAVVTNEDEAEKAVKLIKEHVLISENGFRYDLVFIINDGGSYHQPLRTLLGDALRRFGCESYINMPAGIHFADGSVGDVAGILSMSDLVLEFNNEEAVKTERNTKLFPEKPFLLKTPPKKLTEIEYWFNEDNSFEFKSEGLWSPAWSHMLTNGNMGYIATDAGTGNMWYKNAREYRINKWQNDPLSDCGTETLELCRNGQFISLFAANDGFECKVRYGFGYTRWEKVFSGTKVITTAFIHPETDARVLIIKFEGREDGDSLRYFTELLLGAEEEDIKSVVTGVLANGFYAKNLGNDAMEQAFYLYSNVKAGEYSCDRNSYKTGKLDGRSGAGLDPCFGSRFEIADCVVISCGVDDPERIKELASPERAEKALEEAKEYWYNLVCPVIIKTPKPELDRYINGWALYQVLACRVMGRTSVYQSGGAYGFRDQLQDVCALISSAPEVARRQILMACAHQYEEGDVQHWWHQGRREGFDKGVRTRCSDDLLWLVYTCHEYCIRTGDYGILDMTVDYLRSQELRDGEHDRYEMAEKACAPESVFHHCARALERVLQRGTGAHNLLLILGGDWNDGFDKVGTEGKGESVWLTWFAALVMKDFAGICERVGEIDLSVRYLSEAERLGANADKAWDGKWYLRGYFDNGTAIGSEQNTECKIDSIAQSFAAISGYGDREQVITALKSASGYLFDRKNKMIKLFTPPFDGKSPNPGYILGYLPGVRENGGQYTHAAVWLAMSMLRAELTGEGAEMLTALAPGGRDITEYRTEPYVLTADVYSNPQHTGRGGWSWYTGAAAWYYRVAIEELLGLKMKDGKLTVSPRLPASWESFSVVVRSENTNVNVSRGGRHKVIISQSPLSMEAVRQERKIKNAEIVK